MTDEEKLKAIKEAMDIDEGTIKPTDLLEIYDDWDSLSALSLIAFIDKKLNKTIGESDIRSCKTIQDLMNLM